MVIVVALVMTAMIGAIGIAVDYALIYQARSSLQSAEDTAALASARELGLASTRPDDIQSIADEYIKINFKENRIVGGGAQEALILYTKVSDDRQMVTVDLSYDLKPLFANVFSDKLLPIRVSSTAALAGHQNVCVIALDPAQPSSLAVAGRSSVMANDCGVYANSTSPEAINLTHLSSLASTATFSSGGFNGPMDAFRPEPVTDSPAISDPLIDREPPAAGPCTTDKTDLVLVTDKILLPGTYCGGIKVRRNAIVTLEPGDYVIKDGMLAIMDNASLHGDNVGFYFMGDDATFYFGNTTQANLSAREEGPMAGILFFEDRAAPANRDFVIESRDAERFEGTVYLPKGTLIIKNDSRVGQLSNWTAIVANRFIAGRFNTLAKGPEVVINSDYGASSVPVPRGIAPQSGMPRLVSPDP